MADPNVYDRQIERAWRGDYSTEPRVGATEPRVGATEPRVGATEPRVGATENAWSAPTIDTQADREGARRLSRREVESIVTAEAVSLSNPEIGARWPGPQAQALGPQARTPGPEATMKLARFVKFRAEKFGGVLFETRNEKVYTLNPTAAAVVREIVGGSPDVVKSLLEKYEDKDQTIAAEAQSFIEDLKTKGLVEA